jgi:hypothetical protein
MSDLGSESRVSRQRGGERAECAGRLLQRILNSIVLSLKRRCPSPHYFPNRGLEEEPAIDDEKDVEWPRSPSVIPVGETSITRPRASCTTSACSGRSHEKLPMGSNLDAQFTHPRAV